MYAGPHDWGNLIEGSRPSASFQECGAQGIIPVQGVGVKSPAGLDAQATVHDKYLRHNSLGHKNFDRHEED